MQQITIPPPDSLIFTKRSEAMRYLKFFKRDLQHRSEYVAADVLAIEGSLREPVAYICEALAQGHAHFDGTHGRVDERGLGHDMNIGHLELDEDLADAYETRFGEDAIEEAGHWLMKRLQGESSMMISWALAPIRFPDEKHSLVLEHRIMFDLRTRDFRAVVSHARWDHPDSIQFLVAGGKRKGSRGPKGLRPPSRMPV